MNVSKSIILSLFRILFVKPLSNSVSGTVQGDGDTKLNGLVLILNELMV